ncbi:Nicotinate-nucleotide pyrophosphorylase -like isoform X1 [Oopsacas minuta]|uniref:Nicotinate-nucleotide pyrophosphorylase [carboxylating] n=1 Tax=Oopsacas minuta TaxID=111878 RepID=A0AAV7JTL3_9METZ|nr:Nicotinate-nucleotide pyrophosphorylase -like isoform X1 [Oopsacas minuta]
MASQLSIAPYISHIIPPTTLQGIAKQWLAEDVPSFDIAACVVGDKPEECVLLCKSPGVLCGVPFFNAVFQQLNCDVTWFIAEGTYIDDTPSRIAVVKGPASCILQGERPALNCIARASGIATHARELRRIREEYTWEGQIAGTRKTTPGFRLVEKYALLIGGISTHRYDLSSMVMLKDNHIWSMGSISAAVKRTREIGGFSIKIEVECRSIEEAIEAAKSGADIAMLDNWSPDSAKTAAEQLKNDFPHLIIECSGGIRKDNCHLYFSQNIDVVSMSSTTQGYGVVDFSLKVKRDDIDITNPLRDRIKQ